ncbi:MAG: site-specific DNA-methyltransferase [Candidatus Competibacter sp.]|nr:site-specific DNA-methyltransferase [Candidatus Competibacter sp.]
MADHYDDYTREELIRLLRERDRKPKFGLVWERDEIEHEKSINEDFVTLDFDAGLSCGEAPFRNLIIEGDNFDALRFLRMTHAGKVKCIYIDPPYNTGNRDFIYNDRFIDKEDAYKHSKWLEFMYRRLELAKELLAEDGVIFVSIDDNEVNHLGMLMEQIFGQVNKVGTLIWKRRASPDSRNLNGVSSDHEYIFCYGVSRKFRFKGQKKDLTKYQNPDNDPRGLWMSDNLTGLAGPLERPNLHYDLIDPKSGRKYPPHPTRGWIYSKERLDSLINENKIIWPKTLTGRPRLKRFISDMKSETTGYSTLLTAPANIDGTKELNEILEEKAFSFPKPSDFIYELINQCINEDSIVLDFFAGSGTTAHAVLKLNQEDGGNRRFILISNTEATADAPDKNLCRDVCAERVRRVITGYRNKKGEWVEGLSSDLLATHGAGFAYLRARRIPAERILSAIEHEQVWTALQLIHTERLSPFDSTALIQHAETENGAMLYVPKVSEAIVKAVEQVIHDAGTAVVYSWQPGWLNQHIEDERATFQAIPQFLVHRFGLGART